MKHEIKASARFFVPVIGVFAVMLVLERLSMNLFLAEEPNLYSVWGNIASAIVSAISFLTVVALIALLAGPTLYAATRFYRNMLGDEGYLSFTLPVTTTQHLMSKLLIAGLWQVVMILVASLFGTLFFLTVDAHEVGEFYILMREIISMAFQTGGGWSILAVVLLIFTMLGQIAATFLSIFSAMSIGQCTNKHKLLTSIGVYLGFQIATSTLLQIITTCTMFTGFNWFNDFVLNFDPVNDIYPVICVVLFVFMLINVLIAVLHFFLSKYFLNNKLNLA